MNNNYAQETDPWKAAYAWFDKEDDTPNFYCDLSPCNAFGYTGVEYPLTNADEGEDEDYEPMTKEEHELLAESVWVHYKMKL